MTSKTILVLAITAAFVAGTIATANPVFAPPPDVEVEIDIKPRSDPNSINPQSKGVIPVAILGSDLFDVGDVDTLLLVFGLAGATPTHPNGHFADVNDDGFTDLVTHYRVQETDIVPGDTEACLIGELRDGTTFVGCDSVRTLGN